METLNSSSPVQSIVLIDGPNVDSVLGNCILQDCPRSHERPRWNRVLPILREQVGNVKPYFVFNGDRCRDKVFPLYRALRGFGYNVEAPKAYDDETDPVDTWIIDKIHASVPLIREGCVGSFVLFSHDGGYAPALRRVLDSGGRVLIVGFREELSPPLLELEEHGAQILDLEYDLGAFDVRLGRPFGPPWAA